MCSICCDRDDVPKLTESGLLSRLGREVDYEVTLQ